MATYAENRAWADQFLPEIRVIIGPHLLVPAPLEEDCHEATDLIVLRARDLRIACRVRRYKYLIADNGQYAHQFTLRARAKYGGKTELQKVIEGWGDWLFYGFASRDETCLLHYRLIDLAAFRAQLITNRREIQHGEKPNGDGTKLRWFDVRSFRPDPPLIITEATTLFSLAEAAD